MSETNRKAYVYVRDVFAGVLMETDYGYSFIYDDEYLNIENATAISLTMPMTQKIYDSKNLFPFFDGLIPEGWLLNVITSNWKISTKDRFGVLLVACEDSIGNVSIKNKGDKI